MPLYEYECPACGRFEQMQKLADATLRRCPTCRRAVRRLISAPALQFKGDGFYITDYAQKERKAREKRDTKDGAPKADGEKKSKGDGKAKDSKPSTT